MLIERCIPGTPLSESSELGTVFSVCTDILSNLWKPVSSTTPFVSLEELADNWARELPEKWQRLDRPFGRGLLREAVTLCQELSSSQPEVVLCHQDFHPGNILRDDVRGWLAIDPKPVRGERAFDLAGLFRAPGNLPISRQRREISDQLDALTRELKVDRDRARGWSVIHALAWGLDDRGVHWEMIASAELLAQMGRM